MKETFTLTRTKSTPGTVVFSTDDKKCPAPTIYVTKHSALSEAQRLTVTLEVDLGKAQQTAQPQVR